MDFRQSNSAPASQAPVTRVEPAPVSTPPVSSGGKKKRIINAPPQWLNLLGVVVLFGVAILLALMAFLFARGDATNENNYVNTETHQAVFLSNGQVYFGDITAINSKYLRLNNIYYLTQSSTTTDDTSSSDYTLVKLGCQQIHYPSDQMVINREQITFWENISDKGKVAKSIEEFEKQNPDGPDCSEVTDQTQATSTSSTQGSTSPSNTTTTKSGN